MHNYKKLFVKVFLLLYVGGLAQPSKIGDPIPDIKLLGVINSQNSVINLKQFCLGKPTIINFWHQYCGIGNEFLLALDSLKKANSEVQVLIVGRDSKEDIQKFIKTWKFRNFALPIATNYNELSQWFPHITPPHLIWVGSDAKIKAITGSELLQENSLARFLRNQPLHLPQKFDTIVTKKPFVPSNFQDVNNVTKVQNFSSCSIFTTTSSLRSFYFEYDTNYKAIVVRIITESPQELYKKLYNMPEGQDHYSQYSFPTGFNTLRVDSKVVFEGIFKDTTRDHIIGTMKQFLNQHYKTATKKTHDSSWVYLLQKFGEEDKILSKVTGTFDRYEVLGRIHFRQARLWQVISYINTQGFLDLPVINNTSYRNRVDIDFPASVKSLDELNNSLRSFNLELVKSKRKIEKLTVDHGL